VYNLEKNGNLPLVSVLVPVYNSEETIDRCLDSLKNQTYKNMEIIVIDDGSSDQTIAKASKYDVTTIEIEQNRGAPYAMNVGASQAKGEYVFYIDGDAWAPRGLIEKAVSYLMDNNGFSAVGGWYIPIGGNKLYALYLRTIMFDRINHYGEQVFEGKSDPQIYGCFMGFTRSVLAEEKFTEDLKAIYDREYLARLTYKGYKVLFSKDLFVYHPVPSKLSGVVRSLRVQSMWMGIVGKKIPIIIKYHVLMVLAVTVTLILSVFFSPLIAPIALLAYSLVQARQFLKVRRRFSIKPKKMLELISLTFVLTATVLFGFTVGLFKKPSSHWK
jgi:glycosyltransferase involved in cell wall biosynthesis